MADNIMGGGDEIDLGLNVNLGLDQSIQDASTLANQIKDMREDQEAIINAVSTTQEKMSELTEEYSNQLELRQQMLDAESQLKGISEAVRQNAKDTVDYYRELSNVVSNLAINMGRVSGPAMGSGMPSMGSGTGMGNPNDSAGPVLFEAQGRDLGRKKFGLNPNEVDLRQTPLSEEERERMYGGGGTIASPSTNGGFSGYGTSGPTGNNAPVSAPPGTTPVNTPEGPVLLGPNGDPISTPSIDAPAGTPADQPAPGVQQNLSVLASNFPGFGGGALWSRRLNWISNLFPGAFSQNGSIESNRLAQALGRGLNRLGGGDAGETLPGPNPINGSAGYDGPFTAENVGDTAVGLGRAGLYVQLGQMALQGIQNGFQQGQLYTGLTGGMGVSGALAQNFGAELTAGFGLNPLENYAEAKQIRMNALAQGYGANTPLFNQAVNFGNSALQRYNISPDESAAMFQQVVANAGGSVQQLQGALNALAQTASSTQTSFIGMQQTFMQAQGTGMSLGMTGQTSTAQAVAFAQQLAGSPALNGVQGESTFQGSIIGQAMIASMLGTNVQGLAGYAAGYGGTGSAAGNAGAITEATNDVAARVLGQFGITEQLLNTNYPAFGLQVANSEFALKTVLPVFGFTSLPTSTMGWIQWCEKMLNGASVTAKTGANNNDTSSQANTIANKISGGTNSNFTSAAMNMTAGSLESQMATIQKNNKWSNIGFDSNGQFISEAQFNNMSSQQQQLMIAGVLAGGITMAQGSNGKVTAGGLGSKNTFLESLGLGNQAAELMASNAFGANGGYAQSLQVELGPQAAAFFKIINNPQALQSMLNSWISRNGGK